MKLKNLLHTFIAVPVAAAAFSASAQAESIKLYTEDLPPFNFVQEGQNEPTGSAIGIVNEIFQAAGVDYDIEVVPWKRAYNSALNKPATCVFSTTFTPEREPLFKWVGPIVSSNWYVFAQEGSDVSVDSLDDLKNYSVGGYEGDAVATYLTDQGINVTTTNYDILNARLLSRGRIDTWASSEGGLFFAEQEGISNIVPVAHFKAAQMSIACNKAVPDATIDLLNGKLAELEESGRAEEIRASFAGADLSNVNKIGELAE